MTQVLVCAHHWENIGMAQMIYGGPGGTLSATIPALYRCPTCRSTKNDGDPEPRVILGRIEEEFISDDPERAALIEQFNKGNLRIAPPRMP